MKGTSVNVMKLMRSLPDLDRDAQMREVVAESRRRKGSRLRPGPRLPRHASSLDYYDVRTQNDSEVDLLDELRRRDVTEVGRTGWPDFLVALRGRMVAIEVKHGGDSVSEDQARMFGMLNRAGIRVYVWNPAEPQKLFAWRRYNDRRPGRKENCT